MSGVWWPTARSEVAIRPALIFVLASLGCNGDGNPVDTDTDEPSDTDTEVETDDTDLPPFDRPGPVVVNEIVASNTASWLDNDGSAPDWVEIYNRGPDPVSLSGVTFSDDPTDPGKWAFPTGRTITGFGRLLVLCDGDALTQSGMHTSFKLSSGGEWAVLTGPDGTTWDRVEFPALATDESYARTVDGEGDFAVDETPTPEEPNQ